MATTTERANSSKEKQDRTTLDEIQKGDFVWFKSQIERGDQLFYQYGYGIVHDSNDNGKITVEGRWGELRRELPRSTVTKVENSNERLASIIDAEYGLTQAGATIEIMDAERTWQEAKESFRTRGYCKITIDNLPSGVTDIDGERLIGTNFQPNCTLFAFHTFTLFHKHFTRS